MKLLEGILSFILIWLSISILLLSIKLGVGKLEKPGAGFMPFLASGLMFLLSLFVFVNVIRKSAKHGENERLIPCRSFSRQVCLIISLSIYLFLLEIAGYLITTFMLLLTMFFIFEPNTNKWYLRALTAAIVASISFFGFYKWLGVPLPQGIFRIN